MNLRYQDGLEAQVISDGDNLAHVVALRAASGDKGVAVLGQGRGDDVFKLADLVSTKAKTGGAVLPLGPDLGFGGSGRVDMPCKVRKRVEGRRLVEEERSALK